MHIVCSDLEGIFVPEIWINVSRQTGIEELKLTTRDISDYDVLMRRRIEILRENNLTLADIQNVISKINPLPGAVSFLEWVRSRMQIVIVSDTFTEFAGPLMKQLGYPTIFCHNLVLDPAGMIENYHLRMKDSKRHVAAALQNLRYKVIGIGDSYNDISMLRQSDEGFLFNPPQNVIDEHPDLRRASSYDELQNMIYRITN